jgi:hypothetical protein
MLSLIPSCDSYLCESRFAADVGFLVSGSNRVGARNFKRLLVFVQTVYQGLTVSAVDTRIGLEVYAGGARVQFDYRKYKDTVSLDKAMSAVQYPRGGANRVGRALRNAEKRLIGRSARRKVPQILVVFVTGRSTDGVTRIARRVKRKADIIPIAIGRKPDKRLVKTLASSPDNSVTGIGYKQLPSTRQNVINVIKKSKFFIITSMSKLLKSYW